MLFCHPISHSLQKLFDRCEVLAKIDWSAFEGTEAPAFKTNSIPLRGKELTIVVPEAAFDSFSTADTWKSFNIVKASQSSVEEIESVPADSGCRAVYNFSGRHA